MREGAAPARIFRIFHDIEEDEHADVRPDGKRGDGATLADCLPEDTPVELEELGLEDLSESEEAGKPVVPLSAHHIYLLVQPPSKRLHEFGIAARNRGGPFWHSGRIRPH